MSDELPDGSRQALTLIAFIGSVFSPYYAWARRRHGDGGVPAEAHNALNVSLYRRRPGATHYQRLWTMTERGEAGLRRQERQLQMGPSRLHWASDGLHIDLDEWTFPWPRRVRGRIHVQPLAQPGRVFGLDAQGRHQWQPISPWARVHVDLSQPRQRWEGHAYLDGNHGSRPLECDFTTWEWSRLSHGTQGCEVVYETHERAGQVRTLALFVEPGGELRWLPAPPRCALAPSAWGVARSAPVSALAAPWSLSTLESGPFYTRSLVHTAGPEGERVGVHESLSLQRFSQPWVQALLPFRMPRRAG